MVTTLSYHVSYKRSEFFWLEFLENLPMVADNRELLLLPIIIREFRGDSAALPGLPWAIYNVDNSLAFGTMAMTNYPIDR